MESKSESKSKLKSRLKSKIVTAYLSPVELRALEELRQILGTHSYSRTIRALIMLSYTELKTKMKKD